MSAVDDILELYARRGGASYGEGVSMNEHALQAAWLAEREGAEPELVTAALLHDIGHLLHDLPEDIAEDGIDTAHEMIASAWLSQYFGEEVSEPVRLHVAAKRYLCATEPGYRAALSEASELSLGLQGGPFSPDDAAVFATRFHAAEALRLRRWDDSAKQVGLVTPGFGHFRESLEASLRSAGSLR